MVQKRADLAQQRETDRKKAHQALTNDAHERIRGSIGAQSERMKKWEKANKKYQEDE